jgi:hypothetical protein
MKNPFISFLLFPIVYILGIVTPFILNDVPMHKNTVLEIYVIDPLGSNILFIDGLTVSNERDTTVINFLDKQQLSEYISTATAYTSNLILDEDSTFTEYELNYLVPIK